MQISSSLPFQTELTVLAVADVVTAIRIRR